MFTAYGFTYRTIDINDAIFNAAGACMGLELFLLLRKTYAIFAGEHPPRLAAWKHPHSVPTRGLDQEGTMNSMPG